MPNKSAIKRFPASPGPAVNAEITNAMSSNAMAISAAAAISCLRFFLNFRINTPII